MKHISVSFEVFPTKTEEGCTEILKIVRNLMQWEPAFLSVASLSGQPYESTLRLVRDIYTICPNVVPHLTGVGRTREDVRRIIHDLQAIGVTRILALRGDHHSNAPVGDFPHATDLIQFLKDIHAPFQIGAACYPDGHPEAKDRQDELHWLKQKEESGAAFFISQMCFQPDTFTSFISEARTHGITAPIIPGVLATARTPQAQELINKIGVKLPAHGFDIEQAIAYCHTLMDAGIDQFHFFTFNEPTAAEMCRQLVAVSPQFR